MTRNTFYSRTAAGPPAYAAGPGRRPRPPRHNTGFWLGAAAFAVIMASSAVSTPIYALYERRDHFGSITVTLVYAVYALGVIASLLLAGHVSDWLGRRRVLSWAMAVDIVSMAVFTAWPGVAGLVIARVACGVAVGLASATATSYLVELNAGSGRGERQRADTVAAAANLGGIGTGPLSAGLLVAFAPAPLRLSYIVFGCLIVVLLGGLALAPETVTRPDPVPAYRPQRIAVPAARRGKFFAAALTGLSAFAVFGVFNSLVPAFLAGTLHEQSAAVAGAVAFAAFAGAAVAQIAQFRATSRQLRRRGVPAVAAGLALLAGGMWLPSLTMFVGGGVLCGAGAGTVFKGAIMAAAGTASPGSRAEVMAGFFTGAYVGLSVPVIGLGIAIAYLQARVVMLAFAVVAALAIAVAARAVDAGHGPAPAQTGGTSE
jgi:MFS family permease